MDSQIIEDFVASLIDKVGTDELYAIKEQATIFFSDYKIHKKCTDLVEYEYQFPKEIVKYLASLTINGSSGKTIDGYALQINNFFKFVMKPLTEITSDDIMLYLAKYKQQRGVKDSSLDHYRTILNSFFEWCCLYEYIPKNPCRKIKAIKYWQDKEPALTDFQVESIRAACKSARDLAIIDFLLSTGCRVSEVASVKISDIDFHGQKLDVIGKGNKKRTVYLNGKAVHSINQYLESRGYDSPYLFCGTRKPHGKLKKDAIEKLIRLLGKQVDLPKLHPHQFRRTMATDALRRGMDITLVQKVLGHENIQTTMRYINISQEDVESAHRRFVA